MALRSLYIKKASAAKKEEVLGGFQRNTGRLEAVRLPISAGLPPGGQAVALTPLSSMTLLSSSSYNPAYVPGPTFGFVKLLASLDPHCI